jgi:hypothetical protein
MLPEAERAYLAALLARLRALLGATLVGVYPTGSVALDGYRPGRSDLDLIVVADRPDPQALVALPATLAHEALPCPATGLELVLYERAALAGLATGAGFALNLNTGRELPFRAEYGPGDGPTFWYPIDRDIAHQQRRALTGPPLDTLCSRLPRERLLPVVVDSIAGHLRAIGAHGDNAVLNGCRALRFGVEGRWAAKPAAARWVLEHAPGEGEGEDGTRFAPLVAAALDSHGRDRAAGHLVSTVDAEEFLRFVLHRLEGAG